jgi:hypothetical protein
VGDVNGDGKADLVGLGSGFVFVYLGKGDGTFASPVTYPVLNNFFNVMTVADFNGDGKLDIAIAAASDTTAPGPLAVLFGNGDGTFQPPVTSTGVSSPTLMVAKDVNGDGKADLVISNSTGSTAQTVVLLGKGDGTFQAPGAPLPGSPFFLSAVDVNGDGKPDLLIVGNPFIEVLLGQGDGTFIEKGSYFIQNPGTILTADFNGDGKVDVTTGGVILFGNGDGSLQGNSASFVSPFTSSALTGDFNNDGIPDLAVFAALTHSLS